jgi:hypothetical protein
VIASNGRISGFSVSPSHPLTDVAMIALATAQASTHAPTNSFIVSTLRTS